MTGAVRAPFNLDELFKLAESQLNRQYIFFYHCIIGASLSNRNFPTYPASEHLAIIDRLQDNRFFYEDIIEYLNSRSDFHGKNIGKKKPTDYSLVATAIAQRYVKISGPAFFVLRLNADLDVIGNSPFR